MRIVFAFEAGIGAGRGKLARARSYFFTFLSRVPSHSLGESLSPLTRHMSLVSSSNARLRAARWLVMVVSVVTVLGAAATLVVIWKTVNTGTSLPTRIHDSMWTGWSLLFAGVTFLIAWRGGDHPGNLALALAFGFAGCNETFGILLEQLRANAATRDAVNIPTFILGVGFFILAAARFPRGLTFADIASSRTIWGRIKPLRAVLIFFLRAPAVWVFVATTTVTTELSRNPALMEINWVVLVLIGLIYFHIMYRSADVETRRKVLWFFELTLVSLVIKLLREGVYAVLPSNSSETLRVTVWVLFSGVMCAAQVFCLCMAVFYAGAISPTLVIRKTFVYGITVALLLFIYATAEAFLANLLVDKIGVSNSFANALLGSVLALAFHPIKNRMEHGLRRFGSRDKTPAPVN